MSPSRSRSQLRRAFEVNVVAARRAGLRHAARACWTSAGPHRQPLQRDRRPPGRQVGGNAYAATEAALEVRTVNLAAGLYGSGVIVKVYWPGGVGTAMQAWIRQQDPGHIGAALHEQFTRSFFEGTLITPGQSAVALIAYPGGDDTGAVWDVSAVPHGHEPGHRGLL